MPLVICRLEFIISIWSAKACFRRSNIVFMLQGRIDVADNDAYGHDADANDVDDAKADADANDNDDNFVVYDAKYDATANDGDVTGA